jgi:hypothetical protein
MKAVAMSSEWTDVFAGPAWKAQLLGADLEQRGIPTFTPDANIQGIDPFIRTGLVFDLHLLVPRAAADVAREVIADALRPSDDASDAEPAPSETELARVEGIAHRLRWAAGYEFIAPYGLWLAASYFRAVRSAHLRPRGHGHTIFATVLCAFWTAAILGVICIAGYLAR